MQIHTDQGTNFGSKFFRELCHLLGIDKTRTTALHPQSDGMVERYNSTMESMLATCVAKDQKNWDSLLPLQMMAYRSAEHDTTKYSPNVMMFGRDVRQSVDLLYGTVSNTENFDNLPDYVHNIRTYLDTVHEFARENISNASDKQKWYYDYRINFKPYSVGEAVWLHDPKRKVGISPKLQCNWDGPYLISHCISDLVYRVQKSEATKPRVVHYNRLKPYHGDYDNWLKPKIVENDNNQNADFEESGVSVLELELDESEQSDNSHISQEVETTKTDFGRGHRARRPPNRFVPD